MSKLDTTTHTVAKSILFLSYVLAMSTGLAIVALAQHSPEQEESLQATEGAHQDHEPKHGGVFFMAMNYHDHLEGVLEPPGIFRVYLYDDHTLPLAKDQVRQAHGRLFLGDSNEAPEIPLKLSRDGKTLEATLPKGSKLPLTLTLLMRFPGMTEKDRPELFTFPFDEFSKTNGPTSGTGSHSHTMEGM
jgi:hypothetical protein